MLRLSRRKVQEFNRREHVGCERHTCPVGDLLQRCSRWRESQGGGGGEGRGPDGPGPTLRFDRSRIQSVHPVKRRAPPSRWRASPGPVGGGSPATAVLGPPRSRQAHGYQGRCRRLQRSPAPAASPYPPPWAAPLPSASRRAGSPLPPAHLWANWREKRQPLAVAETAPATTPARSGAARNPARNRTRGRLPRPQACGSSRNKDYVVHVRRRISPLE